MSAKRRRAKAKARTAEFHQRPEARHLCPNCGELTAYGHFAPPGLGTKGGYVCLARTHAGAPL